MKSMYREFRMFFSGSFGSLSHETVKDNVTRDFGLGFLQFLGEIDYGCQGRLCQTVACQLDF